MSEDAGLQLPEDLWDIAYDDLELQEEVSAGGGSYCGTPVAIKEVFEPDNFIIQKLINREVEILKSIRHPNIVQFMGLCCHSSGIYIVTEFVPGGHLWKVLKDKELHLSWSVRVQMATDIAQAMNYLHRRKLLHRDLKTKNLLVDVNYRIKVCDFGFARTTENEKDDKYMTKTGTSLWMAPEMYLGQPYSAKADVFSFGVILREIITRRQPPVRSAVEGFGFIPAAFMADIPAECPSAFAELALSAVAADPNDRPDFAALLAALKTIQSALPAALPSPSSSPRLAASPVPSPVPSSSPAPLGSSYSPASVAAPRPALPPRRPPTSAPAAKPASINDADLLALLDNPLLSPARVPTPPVSPTSPGGNNNKMLPPGMAPPPGLGVRQPPRDALVHADTVSLLNLFQIPAPAATSSSQNFQDANLSVLLKKYPFSSIQNVHSLLAEAQGPNSSKVLIPEALQIRMSAIRFDLHQSLNQTLSLMGKPPTFQDAVGKALRVPPKVNKTEWVVCTTLEMYSLLISSFGMLHSRCTDGTCPTMNASEEISYAWADGELVKTPIMVSAQKYVSLLNDWICSKLQNPSIFPVSDRFSKKTVSPLLKVMGKKLLRIFSHIYFCHWSFILSVDCTDIMTLIFLISYHTCISFKLVDSKLDATTIDPVMLLRRQLGVPGSA